MSMVHDIIQALWQQDFSALADPHVIWVIYGILFTTLFLENGLLPASFLPGDSLLLLTGAMIAKGVMSFFPTMILLTIAASLGCWLSYLQGRWLSDTRLVKGWLLQLPAHYHQRAYHLFHRHGMTALLVGRFLAFIRTLLPTMAGISGLNNTRFQIFNWLSGLLWVGGIVTLGYALSHIPLVKRYEDQVMTALILLPVILLVSGLIGMAVIVWRKKRTVA
ncbi:putative DedA-family membrane protein [Pectobacterium atrosepticum SCRI1043]|uniref:Inner membrane protein YghB n=1 Tax=Pectobacterium atrosepticum (strain SCRI 1043 / ATCC BAA-672) TaxID=218491 RepID=Q6DAA2_PECAS|nr:DedA family protein [Pectobacterium atrosepticum]GKV85974.1 membrane protein [Pectobacterium carotovorum subsp. carotovorum]AIA69369.1 membrane protein [Pectobacterium atrosepticum]AIK12276.1 putative DedA-family membrane protein [Pectobacterium atrosepticum]ATY89217.1 DedA family protein [Pectobacterium atrosepticum]KFX15783.1 membrane protein [Pectobacterium atrosepticum]